MGAGYSAAPVTCDFRVGVERRDLVRCEDQLVARLYRLVRLVIDLLVLRGRRDRSKDARILVCHQLAVLQRRVY